MVSATEGWGHGGNGGRDQGNRLSVQMAQFRWTPTLGGKVFLTTFAFLLFFFSFPAVTGSNTHICLGEKTWTRAESLGCWGSRLGPGGRGVRAACN